MPSWALIPVGCPTGLQSALLMPSALPKAVETKEERVNLVYGAKADLVSGWNARLVPGQPADITLKVTP